MASSTKFCQNSLLCISFAQCQSQPKTKSPTQWRANQTWIKPSLPGSHHGPVLESLTLRSHLKKSAAKLGTRNNLLSKLAGSSWGAQASTLRTSALAICYCAPVWSRSSHTNLIDSQLNETMRIITGTLRPTPLPWLPVLSHIAPPHLHRQEGTW